MTPLTSILEEARDDRQFSGAAYVVGTKDQVLEAGAVGTTAWENGADDRHSAHFFGGSNCKIGQYGAVRKSKLH